MAKIDTMRLWRARMSGWARAPWALVLLFAADLVELSVSLGFALAAPPPALSRPPYVALDVPVTPTQLTLGVALMGVVAGLLMGAALVAEFVVMIRRAQIFSWRYGRAPARLRRGGSARLSLSRRV